MPERRCLGCGESLEGRNAQTEVCGNRCQKRKDRAAKKAAEREGILSKAEIYAWARLVVSHDGLVGFGIEGRLPSEEASCLRRAA